VKQKKGQANDPRIYAGKLAREAVASGRPLEWFESLYAQALSGGVPVPWADRLPNPNLIELFQRNRGLLSGKQALIIGCGFGDDAEWFAAQGFTVTAFDISPSAIDECRRRFAASKVAYDAVDLFKAPSAWELFFDVVVEAYTLQVLPHDLRVKAIEQICRFVSPHGHLLFIARARNKGEPEGGLPWPLVREEIEQFQYYGLQEICFEDYLDCSEKSAVRRFRACYQRSAL
jgi:2-polyprenyl-3-methyl-5-hydroxy-6-metoxy-1,4-benzoquinol methylase